MAGLRLVFRELGTEGDAPPQHPMGLRDGFRSILLGVTRRRVSGNVVARVRLADVSGPRADKPFAVGVELEVVHVRGAVGELRIIGRGGLDDRGPTLPASYQLC